MKKRCGMFQDSWGRKRSAVPAKRKRIIYRSIELSVESASKSKAMEINPSASDTERQNLSRGYESVCLKKKITDSDFESEKNVYIEGKLTMATLALR